MSDTENITCEFEEPIEEPQEIPVETQIEEAVEETSLEEPVEEPAETQVEEPVEEEPVEEEPVETQVEEPAVEESVETQVEEPVETQVEEPAVEEPAVEEPVVEESVETQVEEPVVEEPVETQVEEPAVEEPAVEESVETQVEEPVETQVEEPVETQIEEPVVEETILEKPVVEEPIDAGVVKGAAAPVEEPIDAGVVQGAAAPVEAAPVEVPKVIFIVPYRDRVEQQKFFDFQMKTVLSDYPEGSYRIIYSHQSDQRSFNRGAMKNIGFLYAKSIYPNDYQSMTFVFNDVDTMPFNKGLLNYETTNGNIKHFYGYYFTLGGIVSITGSDFEKTGGFPNYWAWGYEDNAFQSRVQAAGLQIDRSQFYPILDKNILQLKDGITRIVNRGEYDRYVDETRYQNIRDGYFTIDQIQMTFDETSGFLNITNFQTPVPEKPELNKVHDMRDGAVPFLRQAPQRRGRPRMGMSFGI